MIKGFLARFAAGICDVIMGLSLCYILHWHLGHYLASRSVVTFHIGQPGTLWKGLIPWILGLFGTYFYTLPFALFLIFLPEAIWGRSFGKMLLRLPAVSNHLWPRFFLKTTMFWGMTLALVVGSWELMVSSIVVGSIILLTGLHNQRS